LQIDNNIKIMDLNTFPWKEPYFEMSADKSLEFQYTPEKLEPYLIRR
jgi:hypothetical protein